MTYLNLLVHKIKTKKVKCLVKNRQNERKIVNVGLDALLLYEKCDYTFAYYAISINGDCR